MDVVTTETPKKTGKPSERTCVGCRATDAKDALVRFASADEAYDVPGLCQDLAMSRMQLHRKISALAGQPPAQFMRSFRLEKARHLLETTNMNVSEVAYATGFSDHAWFSKSFKEKYGKTPSEARGR